MTLKSNRCIVCPTCHKEQHTPANAVPVNDRIRNSITSPIDLNNYQNFLFPQQNEDRPIPNAFITDLGQNDDKKVSKKRLNPFDTDLGKNDEKKIPTKRLIAFLIQIGFTDAVAAAFEELAKTVRNINSALDINLVDTLLNKTPTDEEMIEKFEEQELTANANLRFLPQNEHFLATLNRIDYAKQGTFVLIGARKDMGRDSRPFLKRKLEDKKYWQWKLEEKWK